MARPEAGLECGKCGAQVMPGEPVCPSCGAHFETALCGRCGYRGPREEFRHHRCPRCGHRADLGPRAIAPLILAAAVFALVILAFAFWR